MKRGRTFPIFTARRRPEDLQSFTERKPKITEYNKVEKSKIDRINELARIAKERELTEDERAEQATLRAEYVAEFRSKLRGESN
jgi:hypothetical protein